MGDVRDHELVSGPQEFANGVEDRLEGLVGRIGRFDADGLTPHGQKRTDLVGPAGLIAIRLHIPNDDVHVRFAVNTAGHGRLRATTTASTRRPTTTQTPRAI